MRQFKLFEKDELAVLMNQIRGLKKQSGSKTAEGLASQVKNNKQIERTESTRALFDKVEDKIIQTAFSLAKDRSLKEFAGGVKLANGNYAIVVLEDVFLTMQNYIKHNTHVGTHNGGVKCSCPNCASEEVVLFKNAFTALGTIKRVMKCNVCGYVYETSNSAYRNFIL